VNDSDFERIRTAKRAAHARLFAIPGVHAAGIGVKVTGGRRTGEPAIVVYTERKRDAAEIPSYHHIPRDIGGIRTDVVEAGIARRHIEHDTDRVRPLKAGTTVMAGGATEFGTLGFFAKSADAIPKIYAVTCHHVVSWPFGSAASNLSVLTPVGTPNPPNADIPPNPYTLTFLQGLPTVTPGTLVVVKMFDSSVTPQSAIHYVDAYVTTKPNDDPTAVAAALANAINGLGIAATAVAAAEKVTVTSPGGAFLVRDCNVYDPAAPEKASELRTSVSGNAITLSGRVTGAYAVYTSWNVNGLHRTEGVFTQLAAGQSLSAAATAIAASVNLRGAAAITATPDGAKKQITIAGADQVTCDVRHDARVGQAADSFGSRCSACCSDLIGHVTAARLDLDVALVRLNTKLEYLAQLKEGAPGGKLDRPLTGTHDVTPAEALTQTYSLHKRGATTGLTDGTVAAIDVAGYTSSSAEKWIVFTRYYDNAIKVLGSGGDFTAPGDSGSAVYNDAGEIVGVLFAGSKYGLVTPINLIFSAFGVSAVTASALGQKNTVTAAAGDTTAVSAMAIPEHLERIERELVAVPAGARYAALVREHFAEAQSLVNRNRRVAAVWRRNGGTHLLQHVLDLAQRPGGSFPAQLGGKPLAECLARIQAIFERYASPAFATDLRRYGSALGLLAGLTYAQALTVLHDLPVD
jgi:hypothetical protein